MWFLNLATACLFSFNLMFGSTWIALGICGFLFFYFEYSYSHLCTWYLFLAVLVGLWVFLFYYYWYLLITAQQQFFLFSWTTSAFGYYFSGLVIDCTSILFSLLIISLVFFIFYFTISYLVATLYNLYFLLLLFCFVISMLLLFHAFDLILLLCAWEFIGLFSYLLVAFFGYNIHVSRAALKTFLFASLSDCLLFLCLCNLFYLTQTTVLSLCLSYINFYFSFHTSPFFYICNFSLCLSSFCNSAQFIFMTWLTDAMEAPTPASALIHSSTLVIAGVYLLFKFNCLWVYQPCVRYVVLCCSCVSVSLAAIIACFQTDVKSLIAFSTISQIGYLFVGVCLFVNVESFFYLWLHAFNNALLFILAGYIIHFCNGLTTMRRSGGMYRFFYPFIAYFCLILINLIGFPLFLGFFFNEYIIYQVFNQFWVFSVVLVTFLLSFGATFFYLYRVYYYLLFASVNLWRCLCGFYTMRGVLGQYELLYNYYSGAGAISAMASYLFFCCVLLCTGGYVFYMFYYTQAYQELPICYTITASLHNYSLYNYIAAINFSRLVCFYFLLYFIIVFYLIALNRYYANSSILSISYYYFFCLSLIIFFFSAGWLYSFVLGSCFFVWLWSFSHRCLKYLRS